MIKVFPFLLAFISFIGFSQTYEIVEVTIECSPKAIDGLNSKGSDFSPVVSGETFFFTSSREYDNFNLGENNWKRSGYLNIFKGKIKEGDDFKVKGIEIVSNKLMTENHTGPLCISASGDTMFFTQVQEISKKNRSKKQKFRPQLYMSVKKGDKWTDPTSMPFNDERFSFGHPSYDSKNKKLYFASDLEGGKGGKDVYYSEIKQGSWTSPTPVTAINTSSNEVFPTVIDDFIFFSSDRAGGKGGLDLYWKPLKGEEKEAVGVKGLNSPEDDFGMYIFPGMTKGFYSNNSGGNDDIFMFDMEKKVTVSNTLAGKFTYRNIDGTASGLKVMVLDDNDQIILETTTNTEGGFKFNNIDFEGDYRIEAKTDEEMYLTIFDENGNPVTKLVSDEHGKFSYKKLGYDKGGTLALIPEDMIDITLNQGHLSGQFIFENFPGQYPDKLKVLLVDEEGNMKFQTFTDENGNFDFRKLDMQENYILTVPDNKDELILLIFDQKGNVVAQLKGDTQGDFVYRKLKPSYANSLSVMEETDEMFELESKTISGYFEYKNIATDLKDGLKIQAYNEGGMLLEETVTDKQGKFRFRSLPLEDNLLFKIDEKDANLELDDFTLYIFDRNGKKIAQLRRGQNDFFIYKPLGFETATNLNTIDEDSLNLNLNISTDHELIRVYFGSNKAEVKSSDISKLSKLYKELKANPELKVDVNAYADATNSDEYNLILSGKRGDWVVAYFVKKGISKKRFIVNAYGETQLVDENNDALNRRAEIRVYK